ncbi:tyrosine-protein phosphatase [Dysgonomonas sp. ZJ279]|uniref:tyrosine-protein phosphatase n=1 Tax=Dysgonomonas sp. ZJ279 TaxID=2709796 RepID=UPI0013E9A5CD|nr:tyrosine-protein phosphatase [Dysgonomonas sp. ZJ279]
MVIKKITYLLSSIFFLASCTQDTSISVLCEKDSKDNYLLKWELFPDLDNIPVEIYMSDNDTIFPSSPLRVVNSGDYIAVINDTIHNMHRKYFRLKVGGKMSGVVTNRYFELDSIQNFRDIGGYYTNDNRQIRWGKIFRSGNFASMTRKDARELNELGVKTVLDMRSQDARERYANYMQSSCYIRIPVISNGYNSISKQIIDGHFLRGDAIIYTQDIYKDMVENYSEQFALMFDYLCNEDNYPVAYHCYLGKDQSGLASYLLLRALDVSPETAEDDYMGSNLGIDRSKLIKRVDTLSESMQEALTMLTKTDLAYLKYGISWMRTKSGSVDDYMTEELRLTPDKRKKLREILLY